MATSIVGVISRAEAKAHGDAPKYYVYHLIDPRDASVFYVGKGCGNRVKDHERDASKLRFMNSEKEDVIHQIWDSGAEVQHAIVRRFENESQAYIFEKSEIERIGIENLTNLTNGGEPEAKKALARGERFVSRMSAMLPRLTQDRADICKRLIAEMEQNISVCRSALGSK